MIHGLPMDEVLHRVGSIAQVARIDSFVEAEGRSRGARRMRMITGGGLELDIHPDRSLDIGHVTIDGTPISWMHPQGIAAPAFYDAQGAEWLRTFGGGFITTCGLDTFGPASADDGVSYGQHGRISGEPATVTAMSVDGTKLVVEGVMRQSRLHGENLVLRRRIESEIGSSIFSVHDVVTNESSQSEGHMIMYHINIGWPLVEDGASFEVPSSSVAGRDDVSKEGLARWASFEGPTSGRKEEVYLHSFDPGDATRLTFTNPRLGLRLAVDYDRRQLPWLCEWKLMSEDAYVVGIEPVNTPTFTGRAGARAEGVLPYLDPGESAEYDLSFTLARS
jgi:hypothetical protein